MFFGVLLEIYLIPSDEMLNFSIFADHLGLSCQLRIEPFNNNFVYLVVSFNCFSLNEVLVPLISAYRLMGLLNFCSE